MKESPQSLKAHTFSAGLFIKCFIKKTINQLKIGLFVAEVSYNEQCKSNNQGDSQQMKNIKPFTLAFVLTAIIGLFLFGVNFKASASSNSRLKLNVNNIYANSKTVTGTATKRNSDRCSG